MKLSAVRETYAALAKSVVADDVSVIDSLPDSITPPVVFVAWSDPWLTYDTLCGFQSNLEMMVVAQRIEPGGQYEVIEDLVSTLVLALRDDHRAVRDITSPYPLQLGGVDYLASSINIIHEVEE